jgi:hypothetical protein
VLAGSDVAWRVHLQETLFNAVAALLYASSSGYLSYAVNIFLRPLYVVTPFFQVYPAMTAAYVSPVGVCPIAHFRQRSICLHPRISAQIKLADYRYHTICNTVCVWRHLGTGICNSTAISTNILELISMQELS